MAQIWIINQYASTPETGMAGRHHCFAENLAKAGHDVSVIAADWHHLLHQTYEAGRAPKERIYGYDFVRIKLLSYPQAHDFRRIINWFLFSHKLAGLPARLNKKPDAILYSSPALIGWAGAKKLADKLGARLIFEVRDIWPLSLTKLGNISPRNPIIRYMKKIEHRAYKESDAIISNLPGTIKHIEQLGLEPSHFTWIPNGISLHDVTNPSSLPANIDAALSPKKFIAGYAGTFGEANALDTIIDAAGLLKAQGDIAFLLVGEGRRKAEITQMISQRGLKNVTLLDAVSKASMPSLLARFDVCLLNWHDANIYRFGTSANKMFEYLHSGRPIVHGYSGFHDYVKIHNAGLSVPAGDAKAFAEAILKMSRLSKKERQEFGQNGKSAVIEHYNYEILSRKLEGIIDQ